MVKFENDPHQRVAYLWTVLAASIVMITASHFLLPTIVTKILTVYVGAKFFVFCFMNHRNVVHWKYTSDE